MGRVRPPLGTGADHAHPVQDGQVSIFGLDTRTNMMDIDTTSAMCHSNFDRVPLTGRAEQWFARLYDVPINTAPSASTPRWPRMNLTDGPDNPAATYSPGGMVRRLELAQRW